MNFEKTLMLYYKFARIFYTPKGCETYKVDTKKEILELFVELRQLKKRGLTSMAKFIKIYKHFEKLRKILGQENLTDDQKDIKAKKIINDISEEFEMLLINYNFKDFMDYFNLERKDFKKVINDDMIEFYYQDTLIYCGYDNISKKNFKELKAEFFKEDLTNYQSFLGNLMNKEFTKYYLERGE